MAPPGPQAFHEVLREAIDRRGLPLERVSAHLRARGHMVSIATLSYWQSGHNLPSRPASLRALGALEAVLDTPRGALAQLIPALPRDAEAPASVALTSVTETAAKLERLAGELEIEWEDALEDIAYQARFFIDERGQLAFLRCRTLFRVRLPDPVFRTGSFHPIPGTEITFTPIWGCELERQDTRREDSVTLVSFRLPELRVGDHHAVEYEVAADTPAHVVIPRGEALFGCTTPVKEMYVEVHFTPGAVPVELQVVDGRDDPRGNPVVPVRDTSASLARTDFAPGQLGFAWELPLATVP